MQRYDAIIIGGGAAGLYAAFHAGRRGRRVLVLEHNAEVGAKILISGGGRCNFTNLNAAPERFISANPHFARSALARHTQHDFTALVQKHRIPFYEKTLGQLFCEGARSSQRIVRMLLDECAAAGVEVRCGVRVRDVRRAERFSVETSAGAFDSETLTIATGGLSIPKLGAGGFAFEIAKQFGLPVTPTRPGLVPLTFGEGDLGWMRPLSGVSADVTVRAGKAAFREAALFTHRGLSGPSVLQASSYRAPGEAIVIDWLPQADEDALAQRKRERPKAQLKSILAELLSERLAAALAEQLPHGAVGDMKDAALIEAARRLKAWPLTPIGDEGYAKAEVMVGGIDTDALSQQTMETRAVSGLFFIGEAVDVTGWLGGYNFQWAWSSGWAAGQAL
ncbi:MAG TPA: NAD(P)/FAD-dependent oxidoreductase [Vitreimonas sp.]|uniref:NAD(P)/FAD-dependent oxidoreductase n=1 Tax=Vitreimonas sp. TaxID=3069702 RepID=UPI002D65C2E9|nr:NAD(P)/FAD-dependent oxidoreductase [Vitreimonas sp.]HYD88052.1 NAD(P)/FAD-dependent oxidoreductase [Vitreimonas sp.]